MPWLILALYILGEPKVVLLLGIITLSSILAFVALEEQLHTEWAKKQQLPEKLARITMRVGAASFFLVMLFLLGLIAMAVRDNAYSSAETFAIGFSSGTAFAYVHLLIRIKKWIKNHGADSKPLA